MRAFDDDVLEWLRNDAIVARWGYRNTSTISQIRAYTLVVDGEASCRIDAAASRRIVDACQCGPWQALVMKKFERPHLLAMEVQMEGLQTHGAWHVDSSSFNIFTIVVPLNDAYDQHRGGCTEVCSDHGDTVLLQCGANEFRTFDGSCLHRRTASASKEWAKKRRTVFIHFADSKRPWFSVSAARAVHTRLKRYPDSRKHDAAEGSKPASQRMTGRSRATRLSGGAMRARPSGTGSASHPYRS